MIPFIADNFDKATCSRLLVAIGAIGAGVGLAVMCLTLCGCSTTLPLTPRIGVDCGLFELKVGGVADLEWHGLKQSDVPQNNSGSGR